MDGGRQSSSPPTPPNSEDIRHDWLRLLRSRRVGVATFYRLLNEHGSAAAALQALPDIAREAGETQYEICPIGVIDAELRAARAAGARMLCRGDDAYPTALQDLPDPPPILWAIGNADLLNQSSIAIAGARNASSLGLRMARHLSRGLTETGYRVVSGLARGIDTAAHTASAHFGPIAVVGGGVDVIYPEENRELQRAIGRDGVVLSEQPMGLAPRAQHFPRRNRIIAALGKATVIVEAAAKSGSLITARDALDIGRDVLAVPGHPLDPRAFGGNALIRDGATMVRGADDVIEHIGQPEAAQAERVETALPPDPTPKPVQTPGTRSLHKQILARIGSSPVPEDHVIRDSSLPSRMITRALTDLELHGRILRQPGGLLSRKR